jgi:uncharacterized membrane protein YidH (DUF202 family)
MGYYYRPRRQGNRPHARLELVVSVVVVVVVVAVLVVFLFVYHDVPLRMS